MNDKIPGGREKRKKEKMIGGIRNKRGKTEEIAEESKAGEGKQRETTVVRNSGKERKRKQKDNKAR